MPGAKKNYKDTWRPKSKASEGPKQSQRVTSAQRLKKKTSKAMRTGSVKATTPISQARAAKAGSEGTKRSVYTFSMPLGQGRGREVFSFSGSPGLKPFAKNISNWKEHRGGRPKSPYRPSKTEGPKRRMPRKQK